MAKVSPEPNTGCWLWTGALFGGEQAGFWFNGKNRCASRVALELLRNDPPPDALMVCHRCDNPACVNPDHLFLGTHQDNMDDMWSKGRGVKGEEKFNSRLTEVQVRQIKIGLEAGESYGSLAKKFGVARPTVRAIKKGRTWAWVTP
jgi:hypothetical protein